MPKLIITIHEKSEKVAGRNMLGFEVTRAVDFEGAGEEQLSFLPILSLVVPHVVLKAIQEIQERTGATFHASGHSDKPTTIDSIMAELRERLEAGDSFPEEIEPLKG